VADSSMARLTRLLPPPTEEVAAVPWHLSRPEIGLDFPSDFREFADRYGGGDLMREDDGSASLSVYGLYGGKRPPRDHGGFRAFMAHQTKQIYPLFANISDTRWGGPFPRVMPDPGGLLAWGDNEDSDIFFWLTEDPDPDRWPVVVLVRGPAVILRFSGGMVDFLVSLLSGGQPTLAYLTDTNLTWVMTNDWLRLRA
jgi:hypothetical protein